ncbi:MAG TPA: hypothetical protein VG722_11115, partial [Tepidisphaeraceae bacterium]|nr:hypothetical protein [Tepidisphaeraceae bacterium]
MKNSKYFISDGRRRAGLSWAGAGVGILLVVGLFSSISFAQPDQPPQQARYVWQSVKIGAGGFIPGIVFSRVQKNLVYLRSDMGGCYRWDNSRKTWAPLEDAMAESNYFGGESIAPDPVDPNVVYIAAGMYRTDPAAMLRSRDQGKTWQVFPVNFKMGGNEDGRGVGERLAVDPNDNHILYFGSRHDGLMESDNCAETWKPVASFPLHGGGEGGLSFVIFDKASGQKGSPTPTIFVGSVDPGAQHLFRSDDAGKTWKSIAGGPSDELLPITAQIDDAGKFLYIAYADGIGPNGVTAGAVMKLNIADGQWTDISPEKGPNPPVGGYAGISLDRQHAGTIGVSTFNHWSPVDTIWRSTDDGKTWMSITDKSVRDVRSTPFLLWGQKQAKLGWWIAAFAIDPFDSDHAVYATGATVFATHDFSNVNRGESTHWRPWVEGIEQTAVLVLISPTSGAHLISGIGDIGGFVHEDLSVSPAKMFENPQFVNTTSLDYAADKPNVIVRSGRPSDGEAAFGYSDDGGESWHPMTIPAESRSRPNPNDYWHTPHSITVSADGAIFMVTARTPILTRDRGKTWIKTEGLLPGDRPVADRVAGQIYYALDFKSGKFFTSTDGGATF